MSQPKWVFVTNLGDASPLEHGGLFLYSDKTGVYPEEIERLEPSTTDDEGGLRWEVRRIVLERLCEVDGMLVSLNAAMYAAEQRRPVSAWKEWFSGSLGEVAKTTGRDLAELREAFCSTDAVTRALAYITVADYHGWYNFDSDPYEFTHVQISRRYTDGELVRKGQTDNEIDNESDNASTER